MVFEETMDSELSTVPSAVSSTISREKIFLIVDRAANHTFEAANNVRNTNKTGLVFRRPYSAT